MTCASAALEQIQFARNYSLRILNTIPHDIWFEFPAGCPSHIGWQAGHLAMAQYRLGLQRIRGERPDDREFFPPEYLKLFGKDTEPAPNSGQYPSPAEVLQVLAAVHQKLIQEVPLVPESDLDLPPFADHPLAKTRLACLFWCAEHEMLHAGQMGLIRRMSGFKPIW